MKLMKLKRVALPKGVVEKVTAEGVREGVVILLKEPEFFCQAIAIDEVIEVKTVLGHSILARFPGEFEELHEEKVPKETKEVKNRMIKDMEIK